MNKHKHEDVAHKLLDENIIFTDGGVDYMYLQLFSDCERAAVATLPEGPYGATFRFADGSMLTVSKPAAIRYKKATEVIGDQDA